MLRVDFIVNDEGVPLVLEGNNLPGFTATSLVPKAAAAAGISFERLTSSMIRAALLRRAENPLNQTARKGSSKSEGQAVNPVLLACNRWLLRAILLLNAAFLVVLAVQFFHFGIISWPLYFSALLMLLVEPAVLWLRSLEK